MVAWDFKTNKHLHWVAYGAGSLGFIV